MSRAKNQRVDRQEKLVHEVVLHERLEEVPLPSTARSPDTCFLSSVIALGT
jgi:hypothetical protein